MNFDTQKWKIYTWKNWMNIHWILNPGLAFNELILGQRVPKIFLEDKESDKPRMERSYVPCPHCEKLHDSRTWSTQNGTAFKNWFGLYCSNCGGIIPCLTNLISRIILILLFPILYFVKEGFKQKWLEKQPDRYKDLDLENVPNPFEGLGWIKVGLGWAFIMFILVTFVFPQFTGETISTKRILIGIPIWSIAGLCIGYTMKLFSGKKNKVKAA